ncbi:MAG: helix-turn-helix domain-containing protein [Chitinivibrionales bacterium]|nr:helix-turn-helix domain-containing protein [Chitinivibrionales bacterium]MBD3355957.1 helix-turn-helix domain-containing protein [Chitinivibrionales bacterium]
MSVTVPVRSILNESKPMPRPEHSAPALENGLRILEMLAATDQPIGFNRIAENLSVSRASVVRLLRVLQKSDYVIKDEESGKYRA